MKKIIGSVLIVLTAIFFLFPVISTVIRSFWTDNTLHLDGYLNLLFDCFVFYPMFWNSILYATAITLLQLLINIPCAFGFVHAKFKGKKPLFVFYIVLMMMPLQVTILPNYIGLRDLGLLYTRMGIVLPMIFAPFGVIVMHQYMRCMDDSLIECMRLETSSIIRVMITAVVPQLKVCIFAVALFLFSECWNMLEQPLLFLRDNSLKTLTVLISQVEQYSGEILASASVVFMIPVLLLYGLFNDTLEKGLYTVISEDVKINT